MPADPTAQRAKTTLRSELRAQRAQRSPVDRSSAAAEICERVLALPEMSSAGTVACYLSTSEEPGTRPLLHELITRRHTVLVPVLQESFDLDWARYEPAALRTSRLGIEQPTGELLGIHAVTDASVVICPGLAADDLGHRLGRGGGSYDRVLARLPATVLRVVLLYDDEVLPVVPADSHDESVHVVITPRRTVRTALSR